MTATETGGDRGCGTANGGGRGCGTASASGGALCVKAGGVSERMAGASGRTGCGPLN